MSVTPKVYMKAMLGPNGQQVSSAQDSNFELWHTEHPLSVVFLLASYSLSETAYIDGNFCGFT